MIGPFVEAWLRTHASEQPQARVFLSGLVAHLGEAAVGQISEVFDADEPFTPGGCVAQA